MPMIQDVTVKIFSHSARPGKLVLSRSAHDRLRNELIASGYTVDDGDLVRVHGIEVDIRPDDAVFFIEQERG